LPKSAQLLGDVDTVLVRAAQKDDEFTNQLHASVAAIVQDWGGHYTIRTYPVLIKCLVALVYHTLTTLTGHQTLGEEYTAILYVDKQRMFPSRVMVLGMC
jgi:hypothetical protein